MFRDRAFNVSVFFSFLWHLFWISAVGIVVTPTVQPSNVYHEVAFLGPILEKTAFELMVEEAKPQSETMYARTVFFPYEVHLRPQGPQRKILGEAVPDTVLEKFSFSIRRYFREKKEIPFYFSEEVRVVYTETIDDSQPSLVEGPAGEREIILKPESPTVSRGLYGNADEYMIRLKFFVSDKGVVYDVEPVISSGYPSVDLRATRFLKKWRFSPLSVVEKDKSSWGMVTIRIEAR